MSVKKSSSKAPVATATKGNTKSAPKASTPAPATATKATAKAKPEVKEEAPAPAKGKASPKATAEVKAPAKSTSKAPAKAEAPAPAPAKAKGKKVKAGEFVPTNYTKQDVIAEMASTHGYTKAEAEKHLDNTISSIETIVNKLTHGTTESGKHKSDKLIFMGFMGIEIAERQPKKGWDNFNQVAINIPAKLAIKLSVGSALKKLVEGK